MPSGASSHVLDPKAPDERLFSNPYPVVDPISNFRERATAKYNAMFQSGRASRGGVPGRYGDEDEHLERLADVRCADLESIAEPHGEDIGVLGAACGAR